jgi:hypothetical protein
MPDTVECLLEMGADPNAVAKDDSMPLSIAMAASPCLERDKIIHALQTRYSVVDYLIVIESK